MTARETVLRVIREDTSDDLPWLDIATMMERTRYHPSFLRTCLAELQRLGAVRASFRDGEWLYRIV